MRRTELLQEIRTMRFTEAFDGWQERRLTQEEAARLPGGHERTSRRWIDRYHDEGSPDWPTSNTGGGCNAGFCDPYQSNQERRLPSLC